MIKGVKSLTTAVAVCLYNGEKFLKEQLDSLRNQTRRADRVVLCDDGSKDNTVALVRSYILENGLQDHWFLYENPENLGYIRNFYRAISLCEEDLVFLSDQDDIWKEDKIEKMASLMEKREEINLLCCRYGIIDSTGEEQHSLVEPKANQDEKIVPVSMQQVVRAYRWPGMLMCLRNSYYRDLIAKANDCKVAHDFVLVSLACDSDSFYEYHYLGAYHRRHENNTAREEHRVSKLLNLDRKLKDIADYRKLCENFVEFDLPVGDKTKMIVEERLLLVRERERALNEKSLKKVISLYCGKKGKNLRFKSFICDLWLVLFGA